MLSYEIEILMIFIYNPLLTSIFFFIYILFKPVSGDGFYMKPSHAAPKTRKYCQISNCN